LELNQSYDLSYRWVRQVTSYVITQFARAYFNVGTPAPAKLWRWRSQSATSRWAQRIDHRA
jgi:hypothetical protein